MVANPGRVPGDGRDPALAQIAELRKQLAALTNKSLYSASVGKGGLTIEGGGSITMTSPTGAKVLLIGPGDANHADGSPQQIAFISDELGHERILVADIGSPAVAGNQRVFIYDAGGRETLSQDLNGGQARPWYNVPLYPYFTSPPNPGTTGTYFAYANIAQSAITPPVVMWEGRIAYVSHPRISVDGTWGFASGGGSVTYDLVVGGTSLGSWTVTSGLTVTQEGPYDISSRLGQSAVPVQVRITAASGGAQLACQPLGCYLRQT